MVLWGDNTASTSLVSCDVDVALFGLPFPGRNRPVPFGKILGSSFFRRSRERKRCALSPEGGRQFLVVALSGPGRSLNWVGNGDVFTIRKNMSIFLINSSSSEDTFFFFSFGKY